MIRYDLYDEAIIGTAMIWRDQQQVRVLVYDAEKIADILCEEGMDPVEVIEFIEYNIEGGYLGIHTPVLVWTQDDWTEE